MEVRALEEADRPWVTALCRRLFAGDEVVSLGRALRPAVLPGLVAWERKRRAGVLCYREEPGGAEIVLLAADPPGRGAGGALLASLEAQGRDRGWTRLRLLTTNDNTPALRFCQRRGWDLVALHAGAVAGDRASKPGIPAAGVDGIPLRHLLELERRLGPREESP